MQGSPRVRRDNRFETNISEYIFALKRIKQVFIRLFRIEANRRILHAKRIKTEVNIPF
jgi:hypothetical protein